ncbi:MAG: PHB depolymerase family esterase [Bacteroidales bacterium]|nr:PHB depolymerase family esterase [Bacteroidales bacterium]
MKKFIFFQSFLFTVFSLFASGLIAQTTVTASMIHGGIQRNYRLYIPASYNQANPAPLVMNLHGYGSNNIEQEFYTLISRVADTAGFLLVHPNGTLDVNNIRHWNTFGTSNVDDVGFLSALIDTLAGNYNVDLNRVYSTGMSNGGFMSFQLACALSHRIAAIASVTGTMVRTNLAACNPGRAVPVMQIHGTADGTVPYAGDVFFAPVQSLLDFWVSNNSCSSTPVITQLPDIDVNDGSTAEHYLYEGGQNGTVVEHFKIIGGGHSWPGAAINLNVTNMDFSASKEIWRFFSKYTLDGLINVGEINFPKNAVITAWPNPSNGIVNLKFVDVREKRIAIYNATGQVVGDFISNTIQKEVSLSHKGLYLIHVNSGKNNQIVKVINH